MNTVDTLLFEAQAAEAAEIKAAMISVDDVLVTQASPDAVAHALAGGVAVIVPPPAVEFTTPGNWLCTWDLWVISTSFEPAEATRDLAPVLGVLADMGATRARPDSFEAQGTVFNGYIITTSSTYSP